jgi:N-acetylmuramoyl-L-alanine amidase
LPRLALQKFESAKLGESTTGMSLPLNEARKNFHKRFAAVSLGFTLLGFSALPSFAAEGSGAGAGNSTHAAANKREAASTQFAKAESMRSVLNERPPNKKTIVEYTRVATAYRMVYVITPHAMEVPDALLAVGEIYTEMGDRFGRSYYQTSVESYQFLIHEYPTSKLVPDTILRIAKLQKNQIGDNQAATKSFEEFLKKYPKSPRRREVQEELAELALLRNSEPGGTLASSAATSAAPTRGATAVKTSPTETSSELPKKEAKTADLHETPKSGGEISSTDQSPRIEKVSMNPTSDGAEVIIDLEDSVQYASGRITNPDRIYFDLHAARLSPSVAHGAIHVTGDLLTQVRVAQNQAGVVRVVLDVNGVKDYAVSMLKKPCRLVIELYANKGPSKSEPMQTARVPRTDNPPDSSSPAQDGELSAAAAIVSDSPALVSAPKNDTLAKTPVVAPPPPAPTTSSSLPATGATNSKPQTASSDGSLTKPVSAKAHSSTSRTKPDLVQPASVPQPMRDGSSSTLTRALGLKIGRIVIDAGHGGHDTGTVGPTGLMEKDLCLDVALRLGRIIQQKLPAADIVYTRSDDTFIPLEERTRIANDAKADLFISIHANSSPDHGARGVETYYLNLQGSADSMEVAARENAAAQQNVHDLEDLVKKIARTEKIGESRELAADIQDSLSKRIQKTAKPVKNRGVRKAPFVVLIGADMPSILTEISFLSNPADEQLLKKPDHRQHVAEGLYAGVIEYLQSMNSVAVNRGGKSSRPPVVTTVEQSRNQN